MAAPFGGTTVPVKYQAAVLASAALHGVPPAFLAAQLNAESGFNPNAVSPDGAIGIAQFLPGTASSVGLNPRDPIASIDAMAKLMAHYKKQFGTWQKALYAYHDGPGKVDSPGPAGKKYAETILSVSQVDGGGSLGGGTTTPVLSLTDPFKATEHLLSAFSDPLRWKRVGYYFLGMALVLIGVLIFMRKPVAQAVESVVSGNVGATKPQRI